MGWRKKMSGKMELQLGFKRILKLETVGASAICGGSLFHGSTEHTAKVVFRLAR